MCKNIIVFHSYEISSYDYFTVVFFNSYGVLQLSSIFAGRGEKAKIGGIFMMGFMAKAAFAVLAIAALKLLTFKALLVGKISLVLSGLQLVKNMMSTGHESSSHVVYSHRRSTGRNFQDNDYSEDSQNVPYNAYQFQQSTS